MIFDRCNRCGSIIAWGDRNPVTCKYITFWEHDTTRFLCNKCYKKFQKYMEKNYNKFFTFLNNAKEDCHKTDCYSCKGCDYEP